MSYSVQSRSQSLPNMKTERITFIEALVNKICLPRDDDTQR